MYGGVYNGLHVCYMSICGIGHGLPDALSHVLENYFFENCHCFCIMFCLTTFVQYKRLENLVPTNVKHVELLI